MYNNLLRGIFVRFLSVCYNRISWAIGEKAYIFYLESDLFKLRVCLKKNSSNLLVLIRDCLGRNGYEDIERYD